MSEHEDLAPAGKGESHRLLQPGTPQVVHMEGHPGVPLTTTPATDI